MSRKAAVLALLLAALTAPAAMGAEEKPPTAIVLTYHIVESPNDTFYSMSREAFRLQMEFLRSTGYSVISLADLNDYIQGRRESIPDPSVVITVDDGWKCTYTEIWPVLREFDFPFTVFVYPKFIGQTSYAMNWKEVREMADAGVDIQSHSNSHPFLTKQGPVSLGAELKASRETLEKKTGRKVRFIAYPYGDYNTRVASATREAGYEAGLTCDFGPVQKGSDPFRMKRVVIYKKTAFAEFRKLLGSQELQLAEAVPAPGSAFDPAAPVISARIADHERLDPQTVQLTVLGLNRTPYSYDPRDGSISLVLREPVENGVYRAAVWGIDRETGKRRDAVWTFKLNRAEDRPAETVARRFPSAAPAASARGRAELATQQR